MSKTAYYADFVIQSVVMGALLSLACLGNGSRDGDHWLLAAAAGVATWTFMEYVLHRFVLHRVPVIAPMHAAHHVSPRALIGTPTWVSLSLFIVVVFLPAWHRLSFGAACGLTAGVMAGFVWYSILHHAIHHGRPHALVTRFPVAARRHMRHHYSRREGNFGVTTSLWDWLFGTRLAASRPGRDPTRP